MKKKAAVLGLVGAMALGTCTVSAANGTKNISATFRNIKIVVDGKQVSTSAEPFIYNGTTYLPIRAVGEAVGKEVSWDAGTNTVYLGEVPASAQQQPATPAPAASSDLPILAEYGYVLGMTDEDVSSLIPDVNSGKKDIEEICRVYADMIDALSTYVGDPQLVKAAYAEAQAALASVADNPQYTALKAEFEDFYQNEILPNL